VFTGRFSSVLVPVDARGWPNGHWHGAALLGSWSDEVWYELGLNCGGAATRQPARKLGLWAVPHEMWNVAEQHVQQTSLPVIAAPPDPI